MLEKRRASTHSDDRSHARLMKKSERPTTRARPAVRHVARAPAIATTTPTIQYAGRVNDWKITRTQLVEVMVCESYLNTKIHRASAVKLAATNTHAITNITSACLGRRLCHAGRNPTSSQP